MLTRYENKSVSLHSIQRANKSGDAQIGLLLPNGVVVVVLPNGSERNFTSLELANQFVSEYNFRRKDATDEKPTEH